MGHCFHCSLQTEGLHRKGDATVFEPRADLIQVALDDGRIYPRKPPADEEPLNTAHAEQQGHNADLRRRARQDAVGDHFAPRGQGVDEGGGRTAAPHTVDGVLDALAAGGCLDGGCQIVAGILCHHHIRTKFLQNLPRNRMANNIDGLDSFQLQILHQNNQSQRIKQSLLDKLKDRGMQKEKYAHIKVIHNGNAMIHAHLFHVEVPAALREDTGRMLARSPELIDALLDLAASHQWMGAAVRVLEFSQYLTQGLFHRDSPFAQLPHLGPEGVKAIMAAKGSVAEKNLPAFLAKKDAEKPGLAKLSPEQREECLAVCKILPDLETAVEVFVEDEEQVAEGDLVTCKVTLTRRNVPEGGKCPTVHAPAYPLPRREAWHALLTSREGKIMGMARITGQGREAVGEVKFMVQRAGPYLFELHLKSLDYLGLDRVHPVKFTVVPAAQLPQYVPHPDDVKLDDEPTLFEQAMMAANVEEDTDSESEDEDEDEEDEDEEEGDEESDDDDEPKKTK